MEGVLYLKATRLAIDDVAVPCSHQPVILLTMLLILLYLGTEGVVGMHDTTYNTPITTSLVELKYLI